MKEIDLHHPLFRAVTFVADERDGHIFHVCVRFDVVHPGGHSVKALAIGSIVHKHDGSCPTIVRGRDRTEAFLPCRVPYLGGIAFVSTISFDDKYPYVLTPNS
jgi:hypothetical protein